MNVIYNGKILSIVDVYNNFLLLYCNTLCEESVFYNPYVLV